MNLQDIQLFNLILISICLTSILASFITIVLCFIPNLIENLSRKLLMCFSLNNIGRCIMFIIGLNSKGYLCLFLGFMKNVFLISNVLWSFFIAKGLVQSLKNREEINPKEFYYWLLGSYLAIPAIESLAFTTNSYDSITCDGITKDLMGVIWRTLLVYLPCTALTISILFMYRNIYKYLNQEYAVNKFEFLIDRGLIYSGQFIIIFLPLPFIRLGLIYFQNSTTEALMLAENVIIYMQGIILLILTLMRSGIREKICCKFNNKNRFLSEGEYINDILN